MKIIVFALIVLLVVGCQSPGSFGGSGSLQIHLPVGSQGRNAKSGGSASTGPADNLVRIQLVRNGVIVPLSGKDYLEQSLAGQTVTLDSLPTGKGFQLFVSTGQYPTAGGTYFETAHYQASSPFEISAGNSTAVSVTLNSTRVKAIEDVAGSAHAIVTGTAGSGLYLIKGADIVSINSGDPSDPANSSEFSYITSYSSSVSGARVYSLGINGGSLMINTDQGLWYAGDGVSLTSTVTPTPVVLQSGFATVTAYSSSNSTTLSGFTGPGLNAAFSLGGSTWSAFNVGFFGFGAASDYAYLSTGLRAVRLTGDFLYSASTGNGNTDLVAAVGTGIDAYNGNQDITLRTSDGTAIGPVSTASDNFSTGYSFAGTRKGLYAGAVDPFSGAPFSGSLGPVPGTSGLNITYLTTQPLAYGAASTYTAAYSNTTREILILKNLDLVDRVKSLEGLPAGDLQLQWYVNSSGATATLYLIASGSDATVAIPIDSWPYVS